MKKRILFLCLIFFGLALTPAAHAEVKHDLLTKRKIAGYKPVQTVVSDLTIVDVGVIKEILKSNQFKFTNGTVFTLDNVRTPIYYEERAKDFLTKTFVGKQVGVYSNTSMPEDGRLDQHSNELIHAITADGHWLEQDLVGQGLAMVTSTENNRDLVIPLYGAEIRARAAHLGFWSSPDLAVKNGDTIKGTSNSYVIFEDVVDKALVQNGVFYLNFVDHNHKHSFTALCTRDLIGRVFPGMDPRKLAGVRIRFRGWAEIQDGQPVLTFSHPEQIEYPEGRPSDLVHAPR